MRRLVMLLACLWSGATLAHISGTGFLAIRVNGADITGSVELSIRDAELAVGVDADHNGKVTWGELRASNPAVDMYVGQHVVLLSAGVVCPLMFKAVEVNNRIDGAYAFLPFTAHCSHAPARLSIIYRMMRGLDTAHRGLLTLIANGVTQTGVLGATDSQVTFALGQPSRWYTFLQYLRVGTEHIWGGIDHLLFLLSLLLPAVLFRSSNHWEPVPAAKPAFLQVVGIVTAFTAAHSITLTLAALNIVHLPSRFTESVIAASIIVAAVNNIFPLVTRARARIAFAFGLLHGFGFASVLAEMGLPASAKLLSLVSFNLGIEAGQLTVVLVVMPVVYLLRHTALYRNTLLPWGSAGIASVAFVWMLQRAFF